MSKDTTEKYNDYTVALAAFDGLPVLMFFINGLLIHKRLRSKLFLGGVMSAFLGGSSKVAWKYIVVKDKKNIEVLTKLFKALLPSGLSVMMLSGTASLISAARKGSLKAILCKAPARSIRCFALGSAGMCLMGYLGKHMDNSARSNWIEESVNAASQASFLIGLIIERSHHLR